MYMNEHGAGQDKIDELVTCISDAIIGLLAGITAINSKPTMPRPIAANDNDKEVERPRGWPGDPMTLKEVQFELRLKEAQIVKLRRMWHFPSPIHRGGKLLFSRREAARWVRSQPNTDNLAAVLRRRQREGFPHRR